MKIIGTEILKFLKNNAIKALIGAVIGAVAVVGFAFMNKDNTIENLQDMETGEFSTNARPAQFRYYVEDNKEHPFGNNLLIEEHFLIPELLEKVSAETNTNLSELIEKTENHATVNYDPTGETKILSVVRDKSTHINTFTINVGDETDNLRIADYYFEYLKDGNVPFLEEKNLFIFQEPLILELDEELLSESTTMNGNSVNAIVLGVAGALFGAIATLVVMLFLSLFSKKLRYSFSYFIPENTYFMLMNNKVEEKEQFDLLLKAPTSANKIAIVESSTSKGLFNSNITDTDNLSVVHNILEVENLDRVDRIILLIEEGQTTRKWYNTQRVLGEKHNVPFYVVQVNK